MTVHDRSCMGIDPADTPSRRGTHRSFRLVITPTAPPATSGVTRHGVPDGDGYPGAGMGARAVGVWVASLSVAAGRAKLQVGMRNLVAGRRME